MVETITISFFAATLVAIIYDFLVRPFTNSQRLFDGMREDLDEVIDMIAESDAVTWGHIPPIIKYKLISPHAKPPEQFHAGDDGNLGLDLKAVSKRVVSSGGITYVEYNTGVSFETPNNIGLFAFPRSSVSERNLMLANGVGVIDRNYRGEVLARFKLAEDIDMDEADWEALTYASGERVIQIVALHAPNVIYSQVKDLSSTLRGDGGFGSTNQKKPKK